MLHVHNGDCSAEVLRKSGLAGEHLAWRETLSAGPAPWGLADAEWHTRRAQFLASAYAVDSTDCKRDLLSQHRALANFTRHDEVTLWFEHDLCCQVLLIYLLHWFAQRELGSTRLSLICIAAFPGVENFRGLGQLTPEQMSSLFEQRHEVGATELTLADEAWQAYGSPDPSFIERLLAKDTSALPYLKPALQCHFARFPSVRNGLGRIENRALELVAGGCNEFDELFCEFGRVEPIYGLGDCQFRDELRRLTDADEPLLSLHETDALGSAAKPRECERIFFRLTESGKAVLAGNADFIDINGIDLWLGGVHLLDGKNVWRWDELRKALVAECVT